MKFCFDQKLYFSTEFAVLVFHALHNVRYRIPRFTAGHYQQPQKLTPCILKHYINLPDTFNVCIIVSFCGQTTPSDAHQNKCQKLMKYHGVGRAVHAG